jgi:hypothetical protein
MSTSAAFFAGAVLLYTIHYSLKIGQLAHVGIIFVKMYKQNIIFEDEKEAYASSWYYLVENSTPTVQPPGMGGAAAGVNPFTADRCETGRHSGAD